MVSTATNTYSKTTSKTTKRKAPHAHQEDAITILIADHIKVKKLFKQFSRLETTEGKQSLAKEICAELTVHATVEEEIFYPAVRVKIKDGDLMNEAIVEHATAKELIAQIENMSSTDAMFDAKVTVLGEYIDHHVKEEQEEMFPKARKAKVDLVELGERIKVRKQELDGAS